MLGVCLPATNHAHGVRPRLTGLSGTQGSQGRARDEPGGSFVGVGGLVRLPASPRHDVGDIGFRIHLP